MLGVGRYKYTITYSYFQQTNIQQSAFLVFAAFLEAMERLIHEALRTYLIKKVKILLTQHAKKCECKLHFVLACP
jgi:hypothetical protein